MNERVRQKVAAIALVCGLTITSAGLVDFIVRPSDAVRGSSTKQEYLEKKNKGSFNKSRSIFDAKKNNRLRSEDKAAMIGGSVLLLVGKVLYKKRRD